MTGDDQVKTLTANGAVDQAYTYINATDAADWGCSKGWYLTADVKNESIIDLTPYLKNSEPLPLGNGLLVLVGSGTTTLTYAGEVISGDTPISLKGNSAFNITGNVSPVDIILGDIGASEGWVTGDDQVKTLTANGAVDQAYTYINATDATDWGCPVGWYLTADVKNESIIDLTPYCQNSVPVAAGEAFVVMVGTGTTTITIPTAL